MDQTNSPTRKSLLSLALQLIHQPKLLTASCRRGLATVCTFYTTPFRPLTALLHFHWLYLWSDLGHLPPPASPLLPFDLPELS